MNVFTKTMRDQRRALTGWALGMAALVLLYASFYPSIKANASKLNQYIETLPEALRNMIGRSADFSSPTGYIQSEIFSIMGPLLLMILAIGAGARAIAGEEEAGTLDLLLANPIARRRVVLEKFWAMVAATAGVGVVMWAAIAAFGPPFGVHVSLARLGETVLSAVLMALGFGAGALAIGCWRGKRGLADRRRDVGGGRHLPAQRVRALGRGRPFAADALALLLLHRQRSPPERAGPLARARAGADRGVADWGWRSSRSSGAI